MDSLTWVGEANPLGGNGQAHPLHHRPPVVTTRSARRCCQVRTFRRLNVSIFRDTHPAILHVWNDRPHQPPTHPPPEGADLRLCKAHLRRSVIDAARISQKARLTREVG